MPRASEWFDNRSVVATGTPDAAASSSYRPQPAASATTHANVAWLGGLAAPASGPPAWSRVCVCGCIHAASAFLQWVACDGSPHPLPPFSCAASHCCPCWPLASWLNLGLGRQAGHDTLPSSLACIVVASLAPWYASPTSANMIPAWVAMGFATSSPTYASAHPQSTNRIRS